MKTKCILFRGTGRINRKEYWLIGILLRDAIFFGTGAVGIAIAIVMEIPAQVLLGAEIADTIALIWGIGVATTMISFRLWTSVAVGMKRWHDVDLTGWMNLLSFIPFAGNVVTIILGCLPGSQWDNKYGPPLGRRNSDTGLTPKQKHKKM